MLFSLLIFLFAPFLTGEQETITVSSKRFLESEVLGEILSQHLENNGFKVERRFGLGGTFIAYQALKEKEIDVYVEYSGTLAEAIYKLPKSSLNDLKLLADQEGLDVLPALGFNNTYAIIINQGTAGKFALKNISDLQSHPDWRGGFSAEFLKRQDGWPSLSKTYNLGNRVRGIENPMGYQALAEGKIQFAEAFSTDSIIQQMSFVVLKDDLDFFPSYLAFPFTHQQLPAKARSALLELAGKFDDQQMMALNARALNRESLNSIARSFLIDAGLAKGSQKIVYRSVVDWSSLLRRTREHLTLTFLAVFFATLIAIPLAILIHNFKHLATPTLSFIGLLQTIPSIALLSFMIPVFGIGFTPALVGLFLYSLLPIVRNTYTALEGIDPNLLVAAKGIGLYPLEVFLSVKLPLSLPVILAGIRTATIINIGTATLAAFIGAGGLGEPIVTGLAMNDSRVILEGALPAAALAIIVDFVFGQIERSYVKHI